MRDPRVKLTLALMALVFILYGFWQTEMQGKSSPQTPAEKNPVHSTETAAPPANVALAPTDTKLEDQFNGLKERTWKSIPSIAQLQELNEAESHFSPEPLQKAGVELGFFAEFIQKQPSFAVQGMEFYQRCSLNAEFPQSVRALCFADLEKLSKNHPEFKTNAEDVPEAIRKLSHNI